MSVQVDHILSHLALIGVLFLEIYLSLISFPNTYQMWRRKRIIRNLSTVLRISIKQNLLTQSHRWKIHFQILRVGSQFICLEFLVSGSFLMISFLVLCFLLDLWVYFEIWGFAFWCYIFLALCVYFEIWGFAFWCYVFELFGCILKYL